VSNTLAILVIQLPNGGLPPIATAGFADEADEIVLQSTWDIVALTL
jgi:hypothetical protein